MADEQETGRSPSRGGRALTQAARRAGAATSRAAGYTYRQARRASSAQGAGETGLYRLIELHAFSAAGDAAVAVSLAGTLFFQVPTGEARLQVAQFLALTMLPFAIVAPLVGPLLDRVAHGRRWAIGSTMALRAFLAWVLAGAVLTDSAVMFPAALGVLVASKAYGVTRASAVPRLLPKEVTLVTANSRISLAGVAGATIGAGIAAGFAAIGPQWSLRWAAVVYTIGLILAIRLPSRVDSPAGEEMTGTAGRDARRRAVTAAVARAIRCNLGLRFVSGFLTMYLAFLLRDKPISGLDGALLAGVVIAAAGIGNSLGTLVGSLLKARKPEVVVLVVLLADAVIAVAVAALYGLAILITLGLVAGLCSSLGKLSLDALIQRDVPETVRTSVFARSETVLQLAWVIGGGCGILMPLMPRLGFGFLAAVLIAVIVLVIRQKPSAPANPRLVGHRPGPSPSHGPAAPSRREPRPERPASTSRTIWTSDEPTVERRADPTEEDAVRGRWWRNGRLDDDKTVEEPAPWSTEPTVEHRPDPSRRRRPGPDTGHNRRPPR